MITALLDPDSRLKKPKTTKTADPGLDQWLILLARRINPVP